MSLPVYLLVRALLLPFQLGSLEFSRALGRCLGRVWWTLDFHHRGVVLRNLRLAFGKDQDDRSLRRLRLRVFENLGMLVSDFAWGMRLRPEDIPARIEVEGLEHHRAAHERSGKCVLIGAHLGNFEWGLTIPAVTGVRFAGVGRKMRNRLLDRYLTRRRERFGLEVWPPKGVVRRFAEEMPPPADIGLMVDQRARRSGVPVEFFGQPANTMVGAAVLALRHGYPLVPLRFSRSERGLQLRFEPALPLPAGSDSEENVRALCRTINEKVEAWVRERPEEWFWVHERWR